VRDKRRVGRPPRVARANETPFVATVEAAKPERETARASQRAAKFAKTFTLNMLSVSTSSRSLTSAPRARRGWRERRGGSRLETIRRAQIGVDLVDAARNGLETFVQRVRRR